MKTLNEIDLEIENTKLKAELLMLNSQIIKFKFEENNNKLKNLIKDKSLIEGVIGNNETSITDPAVDGAKTSKVK